MDMKNRLFRIRITAVFMAAALFFPLIFAERAYAADSYTCTECDSALTYSEDDSLYIHPENDCSHSGEEVSDPSSADWLNTDTEEDANADADGTDDGGEEAFGEGFIRMMLQTIFNTDDGNEGSFLSPGNLLDKTFEYMAGSNGVIDSITESTWYLFLVGSCFIIMLFRFGSDYALEKVWDPSQQTPEMLYKPLFKLIAAMVFVIALPHFLKLGLYLSQAAIHVIKNNPFSADGTDTATILKEAEDSLVAALGFEAGGITKMPQNLGALIQGVLTLILPFLISLVCSVGVFFTCFSRILEISVRAALAPMAMTDIYKMGDRSHGISYLFDFFGVCFQGFAILLVFFVSDYISSLIIKEMIAEFQGLTGTITGISKIAMCMSAINLAKLVIVFRTGSLARSALSGGGA